MCIVLNLDPLFVLKNRYFLVNRNCRCSPFSVLATENARNLDLCCCCYVVWIRQKVNSALFLWVVVVGDDSVSHVAAQSWQLPAMCAMMLCNMLTHHCPMFGTRGRFKWFCPNTSYTFIVNVNMECPELPCVLEISHSKWIFICGNRVCWVTLWRLITVPLKGWKSSDFWERR